MKKVLNKRTNLFFLSFDSIDHVSGLFEKFFRTDILFLEQFQLTFFLNICFIYSL